MSAVPAAADPPPEDHIPELLKSVWRALPATSPKPGLIYCWWGVQVTILVSHEASVLQTAPRP
ncbi:MAG: hypothetical protein LBE22_11505 [Azoarcus sp.]|jgi:hypothetical protein|nr:hypothetical protein [Azoarcus sp.]